MRKIIILLLLFYLTGCASVYIGHTGQAADSVTTAYGMFEKGFSEANPILAPLLDSPSGHVALLVIKIGSFWGIRQIPVKYCKTTYQVTSSLGWGAAIVNLATLLGMINPPIAGIIFIGGSLYAYSFSKRAAEKWCS